MRAALVCNLVCRDMDFNLSRILEMAVSAADAGAELILFPEAALSGLVLTDDPELDMNLTVELPGSETDRLSWFCRKRKVWTGIGLLESCCGRIYDTAVLIDPQGEIQIKYRRIDPGWRDINDDSGVYCEGYEISVAETPFGKTCFLICGDLFNDEVLEIVKAAETDLLLFPFARSLPGGRLDQDDWDRDELPFYVDRIRQTGAAALMINYLAGNDMKEDGSFGGAWAVSADGRILKSMKLGTDGILIVDIERLVK